MTKESGYYGTAGDLEKYQKRNKEVAGEHSKFDHEAGKWSPAIPLQIAIVKRPGGWIKTIEYSVWTVYLARGDKRIFVRNHTESTDPKALDHARGEAQELSELLECEVVYKQTKGALGIWDDLPNP